MKPRISDKIKKKLEGRESRALGPDAAMMGFLLAMREALGKKTTFNKESDKKGKK
jgi:hypothetical protein